MNINDRISYLIDILEIKQKDFADKINIKPNTLSVIKNGKRNVTERIINDICREFDVNQEWLVNGEGEIFKKENEVNIKNYIDELVKCYNLSNKDKHILESYIKMSQDKRDLFYSFICSMNPEYNLKYKNNEISVTNQDIKQKSIYTTTE